MTQAAPPDLSKLRIDRSVAPVASRRRRRWLWWGGILLVLAAAGGWFALQPRAVDRRRRRRWSRPIRRSSSCCSMRPATSSRSARRRSRRRRPGGSNGSASPKARASRPATSSRASTRATWWRKGESAQANVTAARAALEQALAEERDAVAQLKRNQDLLAKGFVSASAVDTAKARAEKATAGVANARATIGAAEATSRNAQVSVDYTVIRAPFDGVILSKSANVGDLVTPFSNATDSKGAVVSMADMSTLEVEADVAESSLSKISVGPAGGDPARRAAGHALSRPHQPHRADGGPRQGHGHDQGEVRRDRSAHPAGDERQGELPVAGRDGGAAEAAGRGGRRRASSSATAAPSSSSSGTAWPSRCRSRRARRSAT